MMHLMNVSGSMPAAPQFTDDGSGAAVIIVNPYSYPIHLFFTEDDTPPVAPINFGVSVEPGKQAPLELKANERIWPVFDEEGGEEVRQVPLHR